MVDVAHEICQSKDLLPQCQVSFWIEFFFEVKMKIMVRSTLLLIGIVIPLHLRTMSSGVLALVISCGDNLIHLEPSVNIDTRWATESPRVGGATREPIGYQISCSCSSGKTFFLLL